MNLHVGFYMYGTIIPDLRSIVYKDKHIDAFATADCVKKTDFFLRGSTPEITTPDYTELIAETYNLTPIDDELLNFIRRLDATGGTISLYISEHLKDCHVWQKTVTSYMSLLPRQLPTKWVATKEMQQELFEAFLPQTSIFVARQMDLVEAVLAHGGNAIHYETASRLQRELELRGYFLEREHSAAKR